jgi:hypothetical protein
MTFFSYRVDNQARHCSRHGGGYCERPQPATLRPANLDRDGAILDPTEFSQSLHKTGDPLAVG